MIKNRGWTINEASGTIRKDKTSNLKNRYKIIFTKGDSTFKTGHIYEVIDGKILNVKATSKGLPCGDHRFLDLDDIKDYFTERDKRKNQPGWSDETLELMEVLND